MTTILTLLGRKSAYVWRVTQRGCVLHVSFWLVLKHLPEGLCSIVEKNQPCVYDAYLENKKQDLCAVKNIQK